MSGIKEIKHGHTKKGQSPRPPGGKGNETSRKRRRNPRNVADWSKVDAGSIQELITNVTSAGGAVRFGYSRDGGAYALGFYDGGDVWTEWCGGTEDATGFVDDWAHEWGE